MSDATYTALLKIDQLLQEAGWSSGEAMHSQDDDVISRLYGDFRAVVAQRAYQKWLKDGCKVGDDARYWQEAQAEVLGEMASSSKDPTPWREPEATKTIGKAFPSKVQS